MHRSPCSCLPKQGDGHPLLQRSFHPARGPQEDARALSVAERRRGVGEGTELGLRLSCELGRSSTVSTWVKVERVQVTPWKLEVVH